MLTDYDRDLAYIPVSMAVLGELRERWSEPVQVRIVGDRFEFRTMPQPVKGVYIVPEHNTGQSQESSDT